MEEITPSNIFATATTTATSGLTSAATVTAAWASPAAWEAAVRASCPASERCALDLAVANSQSFSGFSGFGDARAELARSPLPKQALAHVLALCDAFGVAHAFQARREAVNLKKLALQTVWRAEELEARLLRLSLVVFVGDTSTHPVDRGSGNVYYYPNALGQGSQASSESSVSSSAAGSTGVLRKKVSRRATAGEEEDHVAVAEALLGCRATLAVAADARVKLNA